jgi:hypothetical protein
VGAQSRKIIPVFNESGRDDDRMNLPAEYPALFRRKTDGAVVDGVMVNISNTGIGIRTSRAIALNTELNFITLDKQIAFKVIWCSPESALGEGYESGFRVGLELACGSANLTKTFRWMWERWAIDHF